MNDAARLGVRLPDPVVGDDKGGGMRRGMPASWPIVMQCRKCLRSWRTYAIECLEPPGTALVSMLCEECGGPDEDRAFFDAQENRIRTEPC